MKTAPETLLISAEDQKRIFSNGYADAIEIVEGGLSKRVKGEVVLPDKISVVFDEPTQNRINCMPGALLGDKLYGVKWVAVFPENPKKGFRNVTGTMLLSELEYGHTLSVMDAGYLTEIRTAAVGATAAKYLSRENAETIGFIGAGQQARRHLDLVKVVRPGVKKCYVSSRTEKTVASFIEEESALHPDMEFIACGNDYEAAVRDADIIVTAISGQEDLLKTGWIKKGAFYIHVAGWEDEYAVSKKAKKIVCDDWECIKHRTQTISRMYKAGLLKDEEIYGNLEEIVTGAKPGRENEEEFIYFCSVGLAFIDVSFAKYMYEKCKERGLGTEFRFS
ncbi:MAG: ornithine cyclodeaminase family protein [Lachnospiraceae bacterium]|nr:ornithine cyclodeaminase family protein [Lachnospiraceae bacterium]